MFYRKKLLQKDIADRYIILSAINIQYCTGGAPCQMGEPFITPFYKGDKKA
jgi:hypothetical protein